MAVIWKLAPLRACVQLFQRALGEWGCLTLSLVLCRFRFGWRSSSWAEFRYSLLCSPELLKTGVNLTAVFTLLSISVLFFFFPLEIGTEAGEQVRYLRNYHTEEWYTCLLQVASSQLPKWFSWISPHLSSRRKAPLSLLHEEARESFLTRISEFPIRPVIPMTFFFPFPSLC